MKSKSLITAATVLLAPGLAFAAERNSATIVLDQPMKVADTQLAPGHYKLTWEGDGPSVTVTFSEGKKTFASASARLESNQTHESSAVEADTSGPVPVLTAVDQNKLRIDFEDSSAVAGN